MAVFTALLLTTLPLVYLVASPPWMLPFSFGVLVLHNTITPPMTPARKTAWVIIPAAVHTFITSLFMPAVFPAYPAIYLATAVTLLAGNHTLYRLEKDRKTQHDFIRHSQTSTAVIREILATTTTQETLKEMADEITRILASHYRFDECTLLLATRRGRLVVKGSTLPAPYTKDLEQIAVNRFSELKAHGGKALVSSRAACARCPLSAKRGIGYSFFIPITGEQKSLIGAVLVENRTDKNLENTVEKSFFDLIIENIHIVIKNALYQEQILRSAMTDRLTGAYNRHYMDRVMDKKIQEYTGTGKHFTLAMLDIDHFKHFNDTYGHPFGDIVLKEFVAFFNKNIRQDEDLLFRYGGEEFMLFLADVDPATIYDRLDYLRHQLSTLTFTDDTGAKASITASIGLSGYPNHGSSLDELVQTADQALYHAKHSGRNQTLIHKAPAEKAAM